MVYRNFSEKRAEPSSEAHALLWARRTSSDVNSAWLGDAAAAMADDQATAQRRQSESDGVTASPFLC
jgi:hypothetical protein